MKATRFLVFVLIICGITSCYKTYPPSVAPVLERLEGQWQEAPGIGYREVWKRNRSGLKGAGYMHSGGTFSKTESLAIVIRDSTLVYQATVPDQNEGRTINFSISASSDSTLVFINPDHDFPNVIAYRFLSDSLMHIDVQSLSDSSMNFSLVLKKAGNIAASGS